MTTHEIGAKRHRDMWFEANRRAVEQLWGSPLSPSDPKVKEVIPKIILAVLDGVRLQTDNYVGGEWVKRPTAPGKVTNWPVPNAFR